jgi:hypothetical protein
MLFQVEPESIHVTLWQQELDASCSHPVTLRETVIKGDGLGYLTENFKASQHSVSGMDFTGCF